MVFGKLISYTVYGFFCDKLYRSLRHINPQHLLMSFYSSVAKYPDNPFLMRKLFLIIYASFRIKRDIKTLWFICCINRLYSSGMLNQVSEQHWNISTRSYKICNMEDSDQTWYCLILYSIKIVSMFLSVLQNHTYCILTNNEFSHAYKVLI